MKIGCNKAKIEVTVLEPSTKGPWEPEVAMEFLAQLSHCLTRAQISHWVTYGSLLGLIRQNSLLAWDNDIDIALAPGVSFEAVHGALQEAGLRPQMVKRRDNRVVLAKVCKDGIRADLFLLESQNGTLVDFGGRGDFVLTLSHPAMAVVDRSFGKRTFPVPAEAEAYLAHLYGPQWRVPARNWSWKHSSANRLTLEFNSLRGLLKYARSWLRWQWKGGLPARQKIHERQ